jgi:hypothetical protein
MNIALLVLPVVAAFMAWFTARVLLYSVLYPLRPRRVLGFTMQGYLLKNQKSIAGKIVEGVMTELASSGDSLQLVSPETIKGLEPLIEQHLDSFLKVKLKEKMPVIASFIGDSTIIKLKAGMLEEIELLLPEVIAKYTSSLATDPTLKAKISGKLSDFSPELIDKHIGPQLKSAMGKVPLLFAVAGFVFGLIASLIIALISC